MAKQRKLDDDVKAFIVTQLACFDGPSTVAEAVKAEFGLTVSRQQVSAYDPGTKVGARLSDKWRQVFETTRKEFLEKAAELPIAHRSVRLRTLQRMASAAEKAKNFGLVAQLLEQAAKEMGNAFTNRREVTGKDGGEIQHRVRTLADFYAGPEQGT